MIIDFELGVRLLHGHPIRQAEAMGVVIWRSFHAEKLKWRFHRMLIIFTS